MNLMTQRTSQTIIPPSAILYCEGEALRIAARAKRELARRLLREAKDFELAADASDQRALDVL